MLLFPIQMPVMNRRAFESREYPRSGPTFYARALAPSDHSVVNSSIEDRELLRYANRRVTQTLCLGCRKLRDTRPLLSSDGDGSQYLDETKLREELSKSDISELPSWSKYPWIRVISTAQFPNYFVLHNDFSELKDCALSGCKFCKIIYLEFRSRCHSPHDERELIKIGLVTIKCEMGVDPERMQHYRGRHQERKLFNCFSIKCLSGASTQCEIIKLNPRLGLAQEGEQRNLNEKIDQIRQWTQHCQENHGGCSSTAESLRMPKRLLCVEDVAGKAQLRLTDSTCLETPYLALSYCWGTGLHASLRTTTRNLAQNLKQIEIDELPSTIRDAVILVHRLGMHYLWVDALCIVQDDPLDRDSEIHRMQDIYRNAQVTIAVLSSASAGEGFLRERSGDEPSETVCHFFGERWQASGLIEDWYLARSNSPLSKRAWALQEEILSRRVLFWHHSRLYWRCLETSFCEGLCISNGTTGHADKSTKKATSQRVFNNFTPSIAESWEGSDYAQTLEVLCPNVNSLPGSMVLSRLWASLLIDFCSRSISVPSDNLSALAGLANAFGAATGWHYYYGLFLEMMPSSLLWIGRKSRSLQAKYPSWSPLHCSNYSVRFIGLRGGLSRDWVVIARNVKVSNEGSLLLTAPLQELGNSGDPSIDVYMDEPMNTNPHLILLHILRYGEINPTWCSLVLKKVSTSRYRRIGVSRVQDPRMNTNNVREITLL